MTNEELLDKIMYSQVPIVTILERGEYRAEILRLLEAAVSASRPYEIGLNERLKDPVYAAAYTKALIEDGVSASPQPRCPKCGSDKVALDTIGWVIWCNCINCKTGFGLRQLADFAQFFAAAPSQEPRTWRERQYRNREIESAAQ